MSDPRLAAGIEVSALLARARESGGFGTVLRRGDDERGSLMIVVAERGENRFLLQRLLQRSGDYGWESQEIADSESLAAQLGRARDRDPDLWLIELDVPSAERFIAEMT
ncbi:hypothetical protein GGQ97_000637 [Sphingomonas kaistensis]|uniref:DUF1491 family protein n=1 Tax=Sphingomonas kaistensis TaxID=298708 RepID=A0A7X5Y441_9SPHN|nr:DUF1491 family protein [Sphingomonas kaistensis]NJC04844.1 hypothetical protein [Sphingomonas kaistensis]